MKLTLKIALIALFAINFGSCANSDFMGNGGTSKGKSNNGASGDSAGNTEGGENNGSGDADPNTDSILAKTGEDDELIMTRVNILEEAKTRNYTDSARLVNCPAINPDTPADQRQVYLYSASAPDTKVLEQKVDFSKINGCDMVDGKCILKFPLYGIWGENHLSEEERSSAEKKNLDGDKNFAITNLPMYYATEENPELSGDVATGYFVFLYEAEVKDYDSDACKILVRNEDLTQRSLDGCFTKDTMITMGDGKTQKAISKVTPGNTVWNPVLKRAFGVAEVTKGLEENKIIVLEVGGKNLEVTRGHPFETDKGLKMAYELEVGSKIVNKSGSFDAITAMTYKTIAKGDMVYNIRLTASSDNASHHMIEANGVVAGDLFLQKQLAKEKRAEQADSMAASK